ncbi:hypothetical protein JXO52_09380 [bacterium]|nr:hypothetical protein [bacterium]
MNECEVLATCPFFNDRMAEKPATAGLFKNRYCLGDNTNCARYMVFKTLGRAAVPVDLYPNQEERARAILAGS